MGAAEKINTKDRVGVVSLEDEMMTPREVADLLRIHVNTLYSRAANNEIPSRKKFGKRYFLRSEILRFVRS